MDLHLHAWVGTHYLGFGHHQAWGKLKFADLDLRTNFGCSVVEVEECSFGWRKGTCLVVAVVVVLLLAVVVAVALLDGLAADMAWVAVAVVAVEAEAAVVVVVVVAAAVEDRNEKWVEDWCEDRWQVPGLVQNKTGLQEEALSWSTCYFVAVAAAVVAAAVVAVDKKPLGMRVEMKCLTVSVMGSVEALQKEKECH